MKKTRMLVMWMRPSYDPNRGLDEIIGYVESEKELDQFLSGCQAQLIALSKRYDVQNDNVMVVELGNIENKRFVLVCKLKVIMLSQRASVETVQALDQALRKRLKEQQEWERKYHAGDLKGRPY